MEYDYLMQNCSGMVRRPLEVKLPSGASPGVGRAVSIKIFDCVFQPGTTRSDIAGSAEEVVSLSSPASSGMHELIDLYSPAMTVGEWFKESVKRNFGQQTQQSVAVS
jgi:hypothetical protein